LRLAVCPHLAEAACFMRDVAPTRPLGGVAAAIAVLMKNMELFWMLVGAGVRIMEQIKLATHHDKCVVEGEYETLCTGCEASLGEFGAHTAGPTAFGASADRRSSRCCCEGWLPAVLRRVSSRTRLQGMV